MMYDPKQPYQQCPKCGYYNRAYGEVIACECYRLPCGCFGHCMGHKNPVPKGTPRPVLPATF